MCQLISLMTVVDHKFFGECLIVALQKGGGWNIRHLVQNEVNALHEIELEVPDVILIDWHLVDQGALKLMRHLSQHYPQVKVLIFGVTESEEEIRECVEAGAHGYISREASFDDLLRLIELVARGETACLPDMAHALFSHLSELARSLGPRAGEEPIPLTTREVEVLFYISKGWSNNQIADHLYLSLYTVKNHVHNMLKKLEVENRLEAVEYAQQRHWLNYRHL